MNYRQKQHRDARARRERKSVERRLEKLKSMSNMEYDELQRALPKEKRVSYKKAMRNVAQRIGALPRRILKRAELS